MKRIYSGKYELAYIFNLKNGDEIVLLGALLTGQKEFVNLELDDRHFFDIRKEEILFMEAIKVEEYRRREEMKETILSVNEAFKKLAKDSLDENEKVRNTIDEMNKNLVNSRDEFEIEKRIIQLSKKDCYNIKNLAEMFNYSEEEIWKIISKDKEAKMINCAYKKEGE